MNKYFPAENVFVFQLFLHSKLFFINIVFYWVNLSILSEA